MPMLALLAVVYELPGRLVARMRSADDPERGDVPGWVLVTVMTAALVVALMAVAGPKLTSAFNRAISSVSG
jgi:Tfp pilus assembly protein PilX